MFVAPLLVFVSLLTAHPIDFVFTGFEIGIVALATLIVTVTSRDGETNWLEGAQLLGAYLIIAVTAFFIAAYTHGYAGRTGQRRVGRGKVFEVGLSGNRPACAAGG